MEKLTPQQRNQLAFLGGALVAPEKARDSILRLSPAMFQSGSLRRIFAAIRELTAQGRGLDPVTVAAKAGQDTRNLILHAAETVPSISHIADYEALIVEDYRRDTILAELAALSVQGGDSDGLCARLRTLLDKQDAIRSTQLDASARSFDAVLDAALDSLTHPDRGLKLDWPELDRYGLFEPGNVVVIGGRPGSGKTDFAINLAARLSRRYRVYYLTMEETAEKLVGRLLAKATRIDAARLRDRRLTPAEQTTLHNTAAALRRQHNMVLDSDGKVTVEGIRAKLLCHKPQVAFIDHIGLLTPTDPRQKEYERLSEITRSLKVLAMQMGIVVVELCQLNRAVAREGFAYATLADLRGSGTIEQDANAVVFVRNLAPGGPRLQGADAWRETGVRIAKNRDGALGTLPICWQPQYHDWRPIPQQEEEV